MAGFGNPQPPSGASGTPAALDVGARNLLEGCAGLQPGQRIAILHEDPSLGWYDHAAPLAVAHLAKAMGASAELLEVGGPGTPLAPEVIAAQARADVEVWFARLGDQDRFQARASERVSVVSYARTASELASSFGTRPHAEMVALKHRLDARLAGAGEIRVTCPLGTDLKGHQLGAEPEDVTIRRFPMCVPRPVPASGFSGRVALSGHLTPTGSRTYTPASVALPETVMAHLEAGIVVEYDGDAETVRRIQEHYEHVSGLFGISPEVVHSWHAGLHSGCVFERPAADNPDLWSNSIFGSPGWLHFHTCGDYAPGEICWMVGSPSVIADGAAIWQDGQLSSEMDRPETHDRAQAPKAP